MNRHFQVAKKWPTLFFCGTLLFLSTFGQAHSSTDNLYRFRWLDPDKEVYVLQNKKYKKEGRVHFEVGGGLTTSGPFLDGQNLTGRVGFFLFEEFGAEFLYAKNFSETNATAESVLQSASVPFYRKTVNYFGALFLWAPFYGKLNTFNTIIYFDWFFGLGAGQLSEENNREQFTKSNLKLALTEEKHTALLANIGLKLYLNTRFGVRLDYTSARYKAKGVLNNSTDESWTNHSDLTFSVNFNL